ncbi:hypothetical protein GCG21_10430 [Pseudactinotalea sp. HY160]|uniref:hypothetical protein n=1 Tax=Pseudactinotalea sp. HY160 TaxID=2654490 RepID=UPI00128C0767|nr:hypothetical protein [Pseudactinotalea sp. HY160]MPV50410.1 hypothetical protein [Pseudactinotalea sp. HY160]
MTAAARRDGVDRLVIERDESLQRADRSTIAEVVRRDEGASLEYRHAGPHEQPLLWVGDAAAWCVTNGGEWRRRADPLVESRIFRL